MFTEKEMSDALKWLFDLYHPEDMIVRMTRRKSA